MIKEYLITYEKKTYDGRYIETTEHQIRIPALTLFDAVLNHYSYTDKILAQY